MFDDPKFIPGQRRARTIEIVRLLLPGKWVYKGTCRYEHESGAAVQAFASCATARRRWRLTYTIWRWLDAPVPPRWDFLAIYLGARCVPLAQLKAGLKKWEALDPSAIFNEDRKQSQMLERRRMLERSEREFERK